MDTEDWICCNCQKSNNSTWVFCGSCGQSRNSMNYYGTGDAACSEEFTREGWTCDKCTYDNPEHRRKCQMCYARRTTKTESNHAEGWACHACTYSNAEDRRRCKMCGSLRRTKMESTGTEDLQHEAIDGIKENERRIVLIGKTGVGKSESGNTILGVKHFKSAMCGNSVTKKCQKGEAFKFERYLIVIDTPGLFDTNISNEQSTHEIIKCIGMTSPGPHAFILVVQAGRFTKEEKDTVEHFVQHFGDSMYNYLIVLFTRKDDIERYNQTIDDFVQSVPSDLQSILRRCNNRYVAFNNVTDYCHKNQDVKCLLDMVEQMLRENNGHCYTNEMYQEAEKAMKKRMDMIRKEEEQKREKEKRKLEQEITAKHNGEMEVLRQQSRDAAESNKYKMEQLEKKFKQAEEKKNEHNGEMEVLRQQSRDAAESNKYKMEQLEKKFKQAEEKKNEEIEQMKRRMDEQLLSSEALRRKVRDESEKGFVSYLIDGVKNIGKAIFHPIKKILF